MVWCVCVCRQGRLLRGVLASAGQGKRRLLQYKWGHTAKFRVRCRRAQTSSDAGTSGWSSYVSWREPAELFIWGINAQISNGHSLNFNSSHRHMGQRHLPHSFLLLLLGAALLAHTANEAGSPQMDTSEPVSPGCPLSESGVIECHFCSHHPGSGLSVSRTW